MMKMKTLVPVLLLGLCLLGCRPAAEQRPLPRTIVTTDGDGTICRWWQYREAGTSDCIMKTVLSFILCCLLAMPRGSSDPRDAGLTRMVFRYWLNFIKNGDPNICTDGENQLPEWIPYSRGTESVMYFRDGGRLAPVQNQAQMDLWEEYFRAMRETNK